MAKPEQRSNKAKPPKKIPPVKIPNHPSNKKDKLRKDVAARRRESLKNIRSSERYGRLTQADVAIREIHASFRIKVFNKSTNVVRFLDDSQNEVQVPHGYHFVDNVLDPNNIPGSLVIVQ